MTLGQETDLPGRVISKEEKMPLSPLPIHGMSQKSLSSQLSPS